MGQSQISTPLSCSAISNDLRDNYCILAGLGKRDTSAGTDGDGCVEGTNMCCAYKSVIGVLYYGTQIVCTGN